MKWCRTHAPCRSAAISALLSAKRSSTCSTRSATGELKQAKTIVDSRSELITNAKREAENIMKSAQAQARQLVSQEAIYLEAKNQANDMVRAAQDKIKELKKVTNDYVDDSLRRTEEAVAEALSEIRNSRSKFRALVNPQAKNNSAIIEDV